LVAGKLKFYTLGGFMVEKTRAKLKAKVCFFGDMTDLMTVPWKWLYLTELGEVQFCSSFPPVGPLEPLHKTGAKLHFCSSFAQFCQVFSSFDLSVVSHFRSSFTTVNTPIIRIFLG
jgi:hypothetical protein